MTTVCFRLPPTLSKEHRDRIKAVVAETFSTSRLYFHELRLRLPLRLRLVFKLKNIFDFSPFDIVGILGLFNFMLTLFISSSSCAAANIHKYTKSPTHSLEWIVPPRHKISSVKNYDSSRRCWRTWWLHTKARAIRFINLFYSPMIVLEAWTPVGCSQ